MNNVENWYRGKIKEYQEIKSVVDKCLLELWRKGVIDVPDHLFQTDTVTNLLFKMWLDGEIGIQDSRLIRHEHMARYRLNDD